MSRVHKALLDILGDLMMMIFGTAGVVLCDGWMRIVAAAMLGATAVLFSSDWPRLRAYLVKQRDE